MEVKLPENHIWISCIEETKEEEAFFANMPTEEVFTAALRHGVNGVVYATKPLVLPDGVVEGIRFCFHDGKVAECAAERNRHLLENFLNAHPNADYLGEVALVPHSSPVSQPGFLCYDSSMDENASCHLALGYGYPSTIRHCEGQSEESQSAMGLNLSPVHADFMIGTADMAVTGILPDGAEVPVFRQGEWALAEPGTV